MTRKQIGAVLGAVVLAVAAPFLTLAVLHVLDGTAQAQDTVNFDVDPNVTGNSPNTLGTVEECVRVDVDVSGGFDGNIDYSIDIVVTGDTQAPTGYTASLAYHSGKIHIVDPTDTDIKLQGAVDGSESRPDSDGTYDASVMYIMGGPGTAGNGTITRVGLDIGSSGLVTFYLIAETTSYTSGAGSHQITLDDAWLAINMPCPRAADKRVTDIIFDDASAYPNQGPALVPNNEFGVVAGLPAYLSVTSMDQNLGPDVPADAEISFYANIPIGCSGRWLPDTDTFPFDVHTRFGDPNIPSSGQVVPPVAPMMPGGPGPLFEADLHFQTLEYEMTEPVGPPIPLTRFFELVCPASDDYTFTFCNRADVKPPDTDPDPLNNLLCEDLTVRSIPPQYAVDKQVVDVVFDNASNYPAPGPELSPPNLLTIPVGVDSAISVTSMDQNLGPHPVIPPADAEISFYAMVPEGCEAQFRYDQGVNPLDILTVDGNPNVPSSGGPTGPGWVAGPRVVDLHFQTLEYGMTEPVAIEDPGPTQGPCNDRIDNGSDGLTDMADPDCQASVDITRFFDLRCSEVGTKLFTLCNRADAKEPFEELSPGNNLRCEPLTVQVQGMQADLAKLDLYVKPFYCGDSDMDGGEAARERRLPGTGTCCDGADNNHNGLTDGQDSNCWPYINEDPYGDANGDGCPGVCGVDDDGDTQVDEGPIADDDEDGFEAEDRPGIGCPWNGDDDCDGAVDEDPKNGENDDGDCPPPNTGGDCGTPWSQGGCQEYCDEDPANGFLGIDTDADGWVDEDGAGRFDWNGDTVIEAVQLEGWDDDGDTQVDEDPLDSPAALPGQQPPGYTAHEPHYMVKETLQNNGPNPSVLATDVRQFNAPAWRVDAREDGLTTCNDDLDNDPWNSDGIDAADPDCLATHVWEEAVGLHSCNDGLDNGADGPIDEADSDCQTQTEVSVECWPLDEVVTFGPGVVTRYIKPPSNDPILQAFPWCMQYYDPVHFNKCVPCKIPIPGPPLPAAPCSMLISQIGSPPGPGYCIAADSVQGPPGWPSELGLSEQVTLPMGVPVAREHQSDLACSEQTSLHEFTIRNELQSPGGIPDPDTENNSKEMEMLVACTSFAQAEVHDLIVPPPQNPPPAPPGWNVWVGYPKSTTVSVNATNNGPAPADFIVSLEEESPGKWYPVIPPEEDPDGDGWATAVENILGSRAANTGELAGETGTEPCTNDIDDDGDGYTDENDAGCRTPENLQAAGNTCNDGVDNDGNTVTDAGDLKCVDSDGEGYSDLYEMFSGSHPADPTKSPEHMQFPWTCGDGIDNDGDTFCDSGGCGPLPAEGGTIPTGESPYDGDDYADCSTFQLGSISPPVYCASGWARADLNGDTRPDGTDADEYVHMAGDGTLTVGLNIPLNSLLGPTPPISRKLVLTCFLSKDPYPTETVRARIRAADVHVLDGNPDNNEASTTFGGTASCRLGDVKLDIVSWDFDPPAAPPDFHVKEEQVFQTTKTISNAGGTANPVDVRVRKYLNVPVDCDGSLEISEHLETVFIAEGLKYNVNLGHEPEPPGDWETAPAGGIELTPPQGQTVYVQGEPLPFSQDVAELFAYFTLEDVYQEADREVVENFDIYCREAGNQPFTFSNQITTGDAWPDICMTADSRIRDDHPMLVDVQPAPADVKILDQRIFAANCIDPPPANIDVSESVDICVRKTLHNNGPTSPVTVDINKVATAPPDCTISPLGPPQQVALVTSQTVIHDELFTIHCNQRSTHEFTIDNTISIKDPGVTDPNPTNNHRSSALPVNVWVYADSRAVVSMDTSAWNVNVSTSYRRPVTVNAYNYGPASANFNVNLEGQSRGLWWPAPTPYVEGQDFDGDGWADDVEGILDSKTNDITSTPENLHAAGTCNDFGQDNDGNTVADGDDYKCVDSDFDGYFNMEELFFGSLMFDSLSTPEYMQYPWTCNDRIDNDGDGTCDDVNGACAPGMAKESDAQSDGIPDCDVHQLGDITPPAICVSGFAREDGPDPDVEPDGTDREYVALYPNGSVIAGLTIPVGDPGPWPGVAKQRTLVLHCFQPTTPDTYPVQTVLAENPPMEPHVADPDPSNNVDVEHFDGIADCAHWTDLDIEDWTFEPAGIDPFYVDQEYTLQSTKIIHNINSEAPPWDAVDIHVRKWMNVPPGCEGSLATVDAEEIFIPAGVLYNVDKGHSPDPGDWTMSIGGKLKPGAGHTVYVQGLADLQPAEMEADFITEDWPESIDMTLEEDFDIFCRDTGPHHFEFENQITPNEYPTVCLSNLENIHALVGVDVEALAEADKQVLDLQWATGSDRNTTDPDLDIWTGTDVGILVGSYDQNLGPEATDSTITFLANVPAGCEGRWLAFTGDTLHEYERYDPTDPLTQIHGYAHRPAPAKVPGDGDPEYPDWRSAESALHFQAWEEPMAPTWYGRFFELRCSEDGVRTLTLCNKAEVMAPNVDPNLADNWQCRNLTVHSVDSAPGVDSDGDTVNDDIETYLGTDPADNCPDVVGADDAWPLDNDMTKDISVTGDVFAYVGRIGAHGPPSPSPNWRQRLDLDMSGDITVTGDVFQFVGKIGAACS